MHSVKLGVIVTITFVVCVVVQSSRTAHIIFIMAACLSQVRTREITQNII